MGHERLVRLVRPMNTTDRILGEAKRKVRPPTEKELTDPQRAYLYARDVLNGGFPEGEAAIATSPHWAYPHAKNVIKGRFPEGEAAIATSPHWAHAYAVDVIGGRWPEGEAAIATDPSYAYCYARDVLNGGFPEGEAVIATNPYWSKEYLKRFPEAYGLIKLEWVTRGWLDWFDL